MHDSNKKKGKAPSELRRALGERLKSIRGNSKFTLRTASTKTGLAASTLSKIENGQMSPTYENLIRIASGYEVDIEELVAQRSSKIATARYTVTKSNEGKRLSTDEYDYEFLCSSISHKQIIPIIANVNRHTLEPDGYIKHEGEELIYVLSGQVELHLEHYDSIVLDVGDCVYFDSTMEHALVSKGDHDARIFWACTHIVDKADQPTQSSQT